MNIDDLTIKQARELAALFGDSKPSARVEGDGRYVIVRARDAGVHFGKLVAYEGRVVWLSDSRRMWRWHAAKGISLSDCAVYGINHDGSKICAPLRSISIHDAAEIIDCEPDAANTIISAPVFTP